MTPQRQALIAATIAKLEAAGYQISNAAVYAEVRGSKTEVSSYMAAWRAAQREAGAVAVLETDASEAEAGCQVAPGSSTAPAVVRPARTQEPHCVAMAWAHTAALHALEAAQRRVEEAAIALHQARWQGRLALERLRHASAVARACDPHEVQAAFARLEEAAQGLAAFVGAEEAARAASDLRYAPRGL